MCPHDVIIWQVATMTSSWCQIILVPLLPLVESSLYDLRNNERITPWTTYLTACSLHTSALMKALRISPQFIRSLGRAMYPSFYSISPCPTAARLLSPYRTRHRLDFKIQFMAVLRTFSPCSNRYIKCSQLLEYKLCIYQYCLQIHSLMFF